MIAPLFYAGSARTVRSRGPKYSGTLYYSGGSETITKQGSRCSDTLFRKVTGGGYVRVSSALYYAGSSVTVNKRGSAYSGSLYYDGSDVTIVEQGSRCDEDLYKQGNYYSGGLYHSYKPSSVDNAQLVKAVVNTQNINALTIP